MGRRTAAWLLVAAGSLALTSLGGAAPKAASASQFADPAGDVVPGGMDVTNVTVSAEGERLMFAIEIPTHPTLPATKHIAVGLDVDRNKATGRSGLDYRLWVTGSRNSVELDRWAGTSWVRVPDSSVTHAYQRGVTIGISTLSLGTSSFEFVVATFAQDAVTLEDGAPDQGFWQFDFELTCFGSAPTGPPTEGPDVLIGTAGNDVIHGLGGDDKICAGAGSDQLFGEQGNDQIDAGPDLDGVSGGPGDDRLEGGDGVDLVFYLDSAAAVQVSLATGVATGAGTDALAGFEAIAGSVFGDVLDGGPADDFLFPVLGDDTVRGGGGFDIIGFLKTETNANLATGRATGEGNDRLSQVEGLAVCGSSQSLAPAVSNCGTPASTPAVLVGDRGDNFLLGGDQNDVIMGGGGNDTLRGLGGRDRISGGDGADVLEGGAGNDVLDGGAGDLDVLTYLASQASIRVDLASGRARGDGADTVRGIETVEGSPQRDVLLGDGRPNTLRGGAGDDRLEGRAGDDFLDGGAGQDRLVGGPGRDYCVDGERTPGCEAVDRTRNRPVGAAVRLPTASDGPLAGLGARPILEEAVATRLPSASRSPLTFVLSLMDASNGGAQSVGNRDPGCDSKRRVPVTWANTPYHVPPDPVLAGEQTAKWQAQLRVVKGPVVFSTAEVQTTITGALLRRPGETLEWRDASNRRYRAVRRPLRDARLYVWTGEVRIVGGSTIESRLGVCPRGP